MDVNTGAIRAMYSYPAFDPNVMHPYNSHPLLTDNYTVDLINNPLKPLLNRPTQGQYPPGSIFKIVSAITALESDVFEPEDTYTCTGTWNELGNFVRRDWLAEGHGTLTLKQGLTASCNPWFYQIGFKTGQKSFDLLPTYAREFMMGQELGIEIAENSGLIPDPDWLWQQAGQEWTLDNSVNMAIGQGDVVVTPLQIVTMVSAVANGGTVYKPYLVDRIGLIGEEPSVVVEPEVLHEADVSDETIAAIHEGMRGVATDMTIGTAEYRLGSMSIPVAGKTGTAEAGSGGLPHAWFAGFAPFDDPEIAVVVMIENGGQGSTVASPIFRRIVEGWFNTSVLPYPPDWSDPEIFDFVEEGVPGE